MSVPGMSAQTPGEKAKAKNPELEAGLSKGYESTQNRALRTTQSKSGDIHTFFKKRKDSTENLRLLTNTLHENPALATLLNGRKFTVSVVSSKNPFGSFEIQCKLSGEPPIIFNIVQGVDKKKNPIFYVVIKTDLAQLKNVDGKTLNLDQIQMQRDIAAAMSTVVEDMVQPFKGYTKTSVKAYMKNHGLSEVAEVDAPKPEKEKWWKRKKEEGAQVKAPNTGFYEEGGKLYYIKKSQKFQADDIAEIVTSHLLRRAIGDQAVMYDAVPHAILQNEKGGESVYLASEVFPGFKTLKEQVTLTDKTFGADLRTDKNKEDVYKKLKESNAQKSMARVLAGCAWTLERDCQYGNILLKPGNPGEVKKFDNGWGLAAICAEGNARVKIFAMQAPISPRALATHPALSGIPTNHLNDYPEIVRSKDFVDGIEDVLKHATPENIDKDVDNILKDIKEKYKNAKLEPDALSLFARHIGLDLKKKPEIMDNETYIRLSLRRRLKERADSLAVFRCLLKINLAKDLSGEDVKRLTGELQNEILARFTRVNDYGVNYLTIGEVLPPFEPVSNELIKKLKTAAEKNGMTQETDPTLFKVFELLLTGGRKKSIEELLEVPRIVTPEIAPPLPATPMPVLASERVSVVEPEIAPPMPTTLITPDVEPEIVPPKPVLASERVAPPAPKRSVPPPKRPEAMPVRSPTPPPVDEPPIVIAEKPEQRKPPAHNVPKRPVVAAEKEPVVVPTPVEPGRLPLTPPPTTASVANVKAKWQEAAENKKKLTSDTETQAGKPELPEWKRQLAAANAANKAKPQMGQAQPQVEEPETELQRKLRERLGKMGEGPK